MCVGKIFLLFSESSLGGRSGFVQGLDSSVPVTVSSWMNDIETFWSFDGVLAKEIPS